jgi:4-hydroxy-tetrahydrodipicolinate synthase
MSERALAGKFAEAANIHHRLFPLIKTLFLDGNPAGIKHAMKAAGLDGGEMRLPLWEAGEGTKKQIEEQMRRLGVPIKAA